MGNNLLIIGSGLSRSKNIIGIFCFIILTLFVLLTPIAVNAEVVVQDFRGKTVRLNKPAERVICLLESALTGIYMLKQGHKVVGVPTNVYEEGFYYSETYKYYSALDERIRLRRIPAVGNWESVNVEKIMSLKPDLIIIWASQKDAIQTFEKLGIPVYGVFITKIEDIIKEIRDFGILLGANRRAEELIDFVNKELTKIREMSRLVKNQRKVFFSWAQQNFLQTSCEGSIVNEIIKTIGATNVCANIRAESQTLTIEELIRLNPDVIIMWHAKTLKPEDIVKNRQLKTVNAVKTSRILQFSDTFFFDLWTLKFIYSTKFIANAVYPELYRFELEREKEMIINFLYGIPLIKR